MTDTSPDGTPPGRSAAWHSAHVHYYTADRDGLLLDAVRPLLTELLPKVGGAYVLRHWRQGPHVRIRVRCDDDVWQQVRPIITERIGRYLREVPSTSTVDQAAMLVRHRALAVWENETGAITPILPDNSIVFPAALTGAEAARDPETARFFHDFHADSADLFFAMLEAARSGDDGLPLIASSLMIANAHTVMHPLRRSFVAFRSHAEGFFALSANPDGMRAAFNADYRKHRDALLSRVRAVLATLDGTAVEPVPFVREWAELMKRYALRAEPLLARGQLISVPDPETVLRDEPNMADFHRLMLSSPAYVRSVFENPAFHRYRVTLNLTYLWLTQLGLTPRRRFLLCHLMANAVEELYEVNAVAQIRRFVALT